MFIADYTIFLVILVLPFRPCHHRFIVSILSSLPYFCFFHIPTFLYLIRVCSSPSSVKYVGYRIGIYQSEVPHTIIAIPLILRHKLQRRIKTIHVATLSVAMIADEQTIGHAFLLASIAIVIGISDDTFFSVFRFLVLLLLRLNLNLFFKNTFTIDSNIGEFAFA